VALLLIAVISFAGSAGGTASVAAQSTSQGPSTGPGAAIDVDAFRQVAVRNECADRTNRLFVIDQMVYWTWTGNCSDAAYGSELFGTATTAVLCRAGDSIGGPMERCSDADAKTLFDALNLGQPNLGLDDSHQVMEISLAR
jgi:hypothetical protein